MKGFGFFLMILGGIFIFFTGPFALILIIAGFIFIVVGKDNQKEKEETIVKKRVEEITKDKELFVAKRTKELMETKGLTITDAKAQAEIEYIIESNK